MGFDVSKLTGKLLEFAKVADQNGVGEFAKNGKYLDSSEEVSLFMNQAKEAINQGDISVDDVKGIFGLESTKAKAAPGRQNVISPTYYYDLIESYCNMSRNEREKVSEITGTDAENIIISMADRLDNYLLENGITGLTYLVNRPVEYDFTKLVSKFQELEEKYNDVDNNVENWYQINHHTALKPLLAMVNTTAQNVLGMSYSDFQDKYAAELEAVAQVPPIVNRGSITEIMLHTEAIAQLSDTAKEVCAKVENFSRALAANFDAWESDIKLNASQKTYETYIDYFDDMLTVEMNEFISTSEDLKLPKSPIVNKAFWGAINKVKAGADGIENPTVDNNAKPTTRKIVKGGEVIIERTNSDGSKTYYDASGKQKQVE